MEASLFDLLVNQIGGKVPYTNSGLNLVRNVMKNVLNRFVDRGFITENYTINIPDAADIPVADKNNRVLQGVTFEAELAGAIHTITISGNLQFSGT